MLSCGWKNGMGPPVFFFENVRMSSMWDGLHMKAMKDLPDLPTLGVFVWVQSGGTLDVRTGTQSSELLNAVDSAFWKQLKRKRWSDLRPVAVD